MKKTIKLTAILVLIAGLNACCSPKSAMKNQVKTATIMKQKGQNYETILKESHGGFKDQKVLIINDLQGLSKAMMQLNMIRKPGLHAPKVDFEKSTVLAVFFGTRSTGGYDYEILKLTDDKGIIDLKINEKVPEIATSVITQPCIFIKIPKTSSKAINLNF